MFIYTSADNNLYNPQDKIFNLYPNPSAGKVNINFISSSQNYDISVYSVLGILVWKKQEVSSNCELLLPKGSYIVEVRDGQKFAYKKLIISR